MEEFYLRTKYAEDNFGTDAEISKLFKGCDPKDVKKMMGLIDENGMPIIDEYGRDVTVKKGSEIPRKVYEHKFFSRYLKDGFFEKASKTVEEVLLFKNELRAGCPGYPEVEVNRNGSWAVCRVEEDCGEIGFRLPGENCTRRIDTKQGRTFAEDKQRKLDMFRAVERKPIKVRFMTQVDGMPAASFDVSVRCGPDSNVTFLECVEEAQRQHHDNPFFYDDSGRFTPVTHEGEDDGFYLSTPITHEGKPTRRLIDRELWKSVVEHGKSLDVVFSSAKSRRLEAEAKEERISALEQQVAQYRASLKEATYEVTVEYGYEFNDPSIFYWVRRQRTYGGTVTLQFSSTGVTSKNPSDKFANFMGLGKLGKYLKNCREQFENRLHVRNFVEKLNDDAGKEILGKLDAQQPNWEAPRESPDLYKLVHRLAAFRHGLDRSGEMGKLNMRRAVLSQIAAPGCAGK